MKPEYTNRISKMLFDCFNDAVKEFHNTNLIDETINKTTTNLEALFNEMSNKRVVEARISELYGIRNTQTEVT